MIKVKVINPTLDRNEPTFRIFMACKDHFRNYGVEITESDDFDVMFIGMHDFINKKIPLKYSIEWGTENVEKLTQGGRFMMFDGSDSTSLMGGIEVMRNTNPTRYIKNQLLKRELYNTPADFGRWFWGKGENNLSYDITEDEWKKIALSGWNLGYLQGHLFDKDLIMPSANVKPYDVCAIYQAEHKENYEHEMRNDIPYTKHRRGAWNELSIDFISNKDMLPYQDYINYLYNSKVCLSPFGMGEICFRDFEIWATNTIMVKPTMGLVDTAPNMYVEGKTYFGVQNDWSDLNEVVGGIVEDFNNLNDKVTTYAREQYLKVYDVKNYLEHVVNMFKEINEEETDG